MKRIYVIISIVAIFIVAIFITITSIANKPIADKKEMEVKVLNVHALEVKLENLSVPLTYYGRVNSFTKVNLSSEVSGKILAGEVPLKDGQTFSKGDLLFKVYKEDIEASIISKRSGFLNQIANLLPDINIDFKNEYQKWYAYFDAIDIKKALPELPVINSEKEKIFLSSQNIISTYYSINQLEINLKRYEIYAPFNGSFVTVNSQIGSITSMSQQVASIIQTDVLEVVVPVLVNDAQWIKEGDKVMVKSESGDNSFEGKISRIADFVDASTQRVNVYVRVRSTKENKIYEGQYVYVEFASRAYENVVKVNREVIFDAQFVRLVDSNNVVNVKAIHVVRKADDYYIISGLEDGDVLINESLLDTKDGDTVNIIQ